MKGSVESVDVGNNPDNIEFVPRDVFLTKYSSFVDFLADSEKITEMLDTRGNGAYVSYFWAKKEMLRETLTQDEIGLFEKTLRLLCIKYSIPPYDIIPEANEFVQGEGLHSLSVELAGPIAVGKTTIAKSLASDIEAHESEEGYLPEDNPFLDPSYEDPGLMLRTQLEFLLDNVIGGLRSKFQEGRWTRDTSVLSDIHIFMEWRRRKGYVTPEEYDVYMKTVELLSPLIHKPDLLVMLIPDLLESLRKGLDIRIDAEPDGRKMERQITDDDLACVIDSAHSAVEKLREEGVNVMVIEDINPVELYEKPELRYSSVYEIRKELGILNEYLEKDPEKAAKEIISIFAPSKPSQVVIVHSESMFAGKTSTLTRVASIVGEEKVVAFQPEAALRYGEEHKTNMIDRDRHKIPATTIESNKLEDILRTLDDMEISADSTPILFIDEVMLFKENDKNEAVAVIEELRTRGFQVVVNGIDWTFQELPFTFMHDLVEKTISDENWSEIKLGTRCRYCSRPAKGSRRYTTEGDIASFQDTVYQAGEHYEPVCCAEHVSCVDQPRGFIRGELPTGE
jgi:thymidine kinase/deoxyadenosine/deoxycytidine kinase